MERQDPHHPLNNPAEDPDPTEWPDPYDKREDPRDQEHPPTGSQSTSLPHPDQDPEDEHPDAPEGDRLGD
jgi:hypothetical protein